MSGIIHKPMQNARVSDVAIVSDELFGLNNRTGSQGPLDQWCESAGHSAAWPLADYGINAEPGRPSQWQPISTSV